MVDLGGWWHGGSWRFSATRYVPVPDGESLRHRCGNPFSGTLVNSRLATCNVFAVSVAYSGMLPQLMSSRALVRLSGAALCTAAFSTSLGIRSGIRTSRRRRAYSSTRRVENYLPMVLESTPRGERAYDIYSRLLRVSSRHRAASLCYAKGARKPKLVYNR